MDGWMAESEGSKFLQNVSCKIHGVYIFFSAFEDSSVCTVSYYGLGTWLWQNFFASACQDQLWPKPVIVDSGFL
jgi:hypothetical protein